MLLLRRFFERIIAIIGRLLFAIFIIVPLIEIGLFIGIGGLIGLWPTLLGVVVTAFIGSAIIRSQGMSLLSDIRQSANAGQLPAQQIAEAMMLAISGALLLTPGYFTDVCGFLLLVPPVRLAIYHFLKSRVHIVGATASSGPQRGPDPIDPDVIDLSSDDWRGQ